MDNSYDNLTIYDGSSSRSGRVANLYGKNEFRGMTSTSNNLFFVFNSDPYIEYEGFKLIFTLNGMKIDFIVNLDQLLDQETNN